MPSHVLPFRRSGQAAAGAFRVWVIGCAAVVASALTVGCRSELEGVQDGRAFLVDLPVPKEDWARLVEAGWEKRVGANLGLWVSVERQKLVGIENGRIRFVCICSTAAKGVGNREGSNQTPLGWHEIDERIGDGLPVGAVFVGRKFTGQVWQPGERTTKDLVLTRILWLRGLEPGKNAGPGIDSHARYIYIHGTPAEEKLGTPASMGCVRLSNEEMVQVFERAESGVRVLISEW